MRRLVWAFVIRMYQRRISRDKVYTIFKNSKFDVKVYTRYTSSVYVEGFRLSVCLFDLSYVRYIRLLVRSFVIPLINLSLSLSLLADADPERFDFDNGLLNAVFVDEGREDPNTTKAGHQRPASETPFDDPVNFSGIAL